MWITTRPGLLNVLIADRDLLVLHFILTCLWELRYHRWGYQFYSDILALSCFPQLCFARFDCSQNFKQLTLFIQVDKGELKYISYKNVGG